MYRLTLYSLLVAVLSLSACHSAKKTTYIKRFHKDARCEMTAGKIRLKADTVRIIYPELAMFDFGKAEIKPDAAASMQHFASLLSRYERINCIINGYTDNIGTNMVNEDLSRRRADNAKTLFESNGISSSRLQTNGMGAAHPVADNETEEGRSANRRVEFLLFERK